MARYAVGDTVSRAEWDQPRDPKGRFTFKVRRWLKEARHRPLRPDLSLLIIAILMFCMFVLTAITYDRQQRNEARMEAFIQDVLEANQRGMKMAVDAATAVSLSQKQNLEEVLAGLDLSTQVSEEALKTIKSK